MKLPAPRSNPKQLLAKQTEAHHPSSNSFKPVTRLLQLGQASVQVLLLSCCRALQALAAALHSTPLCLQAVLG